jgi:hypothetical protein
MRPRCIRAFLIAILPFGLALLAISNASPFATAQLMGKIKGVVLDPNDARIVGATITVKSDKLNRTIRSNDAGEFEVEVPTSSYQLYAEAFWFKKSDAADLQVKAGEVSSVSFYLFPDTSHRELDPPFGERIEQQNAPPELSKKIEKRKLQ